MPSLSHLKLFGSCYAEDKLQREKGRESVCVCVCVCVVCSAGTGRRVAYV
jgi:hypothetical protein